MEFDENKTTEFKEAFSRDLTNMFHSMRKESPDAVAQWLVNLSHLADNSSKKLQDFEHKEKLTEDIKTAVQEYNTDRKSVV